MTPAWAAVSVQLQIISSEGFLAKVMLDLLEECGCPVQPRSWDRIRIRV